MSLWTIHDSKGGERSVAADVACGVLWIVWNVVRLPILAILLILEPAVTLVLWGAAFLGILTSLLFEFSGAVPDFPFWLMMSISVSWALLLLAYHALLRLLS